MSMSFRVLSTLEELEIFAQRSCALVGNQIPLAYFQAGRVVGTFIDGRMVGGWALAYPACGTLRCVLALPDALPQKAELMTLTSAGTLCEITQVWLDPHEANARQSIVFWVKLGDDIISNGAQQIIFGCKSQNKGLLRLYDRLDPRPVYAGPTGVGLQSHSEVTIMLVDQEKFRFIFWRHLGEMVRRVFRKKRGIQRLTGAPARAPTQTSELRKLG